MLGTSTPHPLHPPKLLLIHLHLLLLFRLQAFAMARALTLAHCARYVGDTLLAPALPCLVCEEESVLPSAASVPLPALEGVDLSQGLPAAVPGYENVRLLAPHAELRLLACGLSTLINAQSLTHLCEASEWLCACCCAAAFVLPSFPMHCGCPAVLVVA